MKKLISWEVKIPDTLIDHIDSDYVNGNGSFVFKTQKHARHMEAALVIAEKLLNQVYRQDIRMCHNGEAFVVMLTLDGLLPTDIERTDDAPVFMDALTNFVSEWKDTGRNADIEEGDK